MEQLPASFFNRSQVDVIAAELLGKQLVTCLNGVITAGIIVETEAYYGAIDKASHAYGGRRTKRTETLYAAGGTAYVYLCYGIHHLFNIVTNQANIPHAVLIRAVEPTQGIEEICRRMNRPKPDYRMTSGPGNSCKALGINRKHNGIDLLTSPEIQICEGLTIDPEGIGTSPRIGVDYAGEDALLPYRFYIKGNRYVSGKVRN